MLLQTQCVLGEVFIEGKKRGKERERGREREKRERSMQVIVLVSESGRFEPTTPA